MSARWIGLAVLLCACAGFARAQEEAPATAEKPASFQPVETDATRAMARRVKESCAEAKGLRDAKKMTEARAAVRAVSRDALALPGREKSQVLERELEQLAIVAESLVDHECRIELLEACLAFRIAAQGADAEEVQILRNNLGNAYWETGELVRSRELLSQAVECFSRTLAPEDPRLNEAKSNLGVVQFKSGDFEGAYATFSAVLAKIETTNKKDDPQIQWAYGNVANVLDALGDVEKARQYRERVHAVLSAALPADDPEVLTARENLGLALRKTGDLVGAKMLLAEVLEIRERTLPPTSRVLEGSRQNLATALIDLGDDHGARILLEGVVSRMEARLPEADLGLYTARQNLRTVVARLGDFQRAKEIAEHNYEVVLEARGPQHRLTIDAMIAYADSLDNTGDLDAAYELASSGLETMREMGGDDSPQLMLAESATATMLLRLGRREEGSALNESIVQRLVARCGPASPRVLMAKARFAGGLEDLDPARSVVVLREVGAALLPTVGAAARVLSPREADLVALHTSELIDPVILRCRAPTDAVLCFQLIESQRSAALASARSLRELDRASTGDPAIVELRDELRRKSAAMATLADAGSREQYQTAVLERGALEHRLCEAVAGFRDVAAIESRPEVLARHLPVGSAAVSFRRLEVREKGSEAAPKSVSFFAFVLHADGSLVRVELGPAQAIEAAVARWRQSLGLGESSTPGSADEVRAAGEDLRKLVFDPVLAAAKESTRLVLACDDVLHLVPFDALPLGEGVVGDKVAVELRTCLAELAPSPTDHPLAHDLIALGGIDFDAEPGAREPVEASVGDSAPEPEPITVASRGSSERAGLRPRHFEPLLSSLDEVRSIASLFERAADKGDKTGANADRGVTLLVGSKADKDALIAAAPRARFLHVATHGYSVGELGESPATGPGFAAEVRGISPSVLCGLALAGANRALDAVHRTRGTLTAEELAYLELDGCELAVLSACDSNVGVRRAGVAIASLQNALRAAGARSTLTSLWKVPDAATRELMLAFYRGIWVDHLPKAQALWRAKQTLRERRAAPRDWAGWVLTGAGD